MKTLYPVIAFLLMLSSSVNAQLHEHALQFKQESLPFIQNNGQWNDNVQYRVPIGNGSVYLEKNGFTFVQYDPADIDMLHVHLDETKHETHKEIVKGHAWRTHFLDANENPKITAANKRDEYHNYYLGQDQSKWASNVPIYNCVSYENLYDNIDLKIYSVNGHYKYDFIIAPKTKPTIIQMDYSGLEQLEIREGHLIAITTVGEFIEEAPYAYQIINGVETPVPCNYTLNGTTVGFKFPKGYDKKVELIIDPVLVGATLSGSTVLNYGHCATYDYEENIYTGARNFGIGYPTTDGSFQVDFGGFHDIAISKYNPDATALIYATYLGGTGIDYPSSIVVNEDNELYLLGTSASFDFPVSDDAFSDAGSGTKLIVTHFSVDGTAIIGSTYIGGTGTDGLNELTDNEGDGSRGEIIVDVAGNCYVASCSNSTDFPTTVGAYQEIFGGGVQDAVIFSMPPDLSSLNWSTYIGGSSGEGAFGLQLDTDNNLYIAGVASDEFITMTGYQATYQGGLRDGFVIKLIDNGTTIEYSSYWGTADKDAAFNVDLDVEGNAYLYGQSDGGTSEVTADVYSNPGSHQFICKLSPNLEDLLMGTVIGGGGDDFIPSAFMVDECGFIYFSGNRAEGELPLTADAILESGGMYVGVLQANAADLEFATKYSGIHVHGGTSRFDPANKTIYQAVCSCEGFVTTPGAYDPINDGICDMGVFKIDFEITSVHANAIISPATIGCTPFTVDFENLSTGGIFEWNFDDGTPVSTEFEPTHTFTDAGGYMIQLIATDSTGCLLPDTTYISIIVSDPITPEISFEFEIDCATGSVSITYTGDEDVPIVFDMGDGTTYSDTVFSHFYTEDGLFTITLTVGDGDCINFVTITEEILLGEAAVDIIFNNPTCYLFPDGSVTIDVLETTGDEVIEIVDSAGTLLNVGGSNTANTLTSGWYYYTVDLGNGCSSSDSILLVDPPAITADISVFDALCFDQASGTVIVDTVYNWQGDYSDMVYIWAPDPNEASGIGADTLSDIPVGTYTLTINDGNGCSRIFDFTIEQPPPMEWTEFGMESAYCRLYGYQSGNGVVFAAVNGGIPDYTYLWTNLETGETNENTTWGGLNPGTYEMVATDENGCELIQQIVLDSLNPIADFTASSNQSETDCFAIVPVDVTYTNQSLYFANPNDPFADTTFLFNSDHPNVDWIISHDLYQTYDVNYSVSADYEVCLIALNKNGCSDTTCKIIVICDPFIFDPVNIFSPNDDGINDEFNFIDRSQAVRDFYCVVLNRWGVVIAEFNSIDNGWDGTNSKGNLVPDGVYFYKYTGVGDTGEAFEGQGTVQKVSGK
ncbi:MAG: T9SS type B sorting domain-containing protein [Crocinitomix sp.]|nr:T9SS type B sorting domain-containing protein [Crocinitomix sp.]